MTHNKILFIGTQNILLYSSSIKNTLINLGFNVTEPEYLKFKDQNAIQKRFCRKKFLNDFFHRQNIAYIDAAKKIKPNYVFVLNNSRMTTDFLQYCNQNKIPLIMYCIDSIRWCDKALEHMHYYDEIFSYEPSDTQIEFKPNKSVKFLPLGFDSNIYKPNNNIINKEYDLCFVGRLDKHRLNTLESVAKYAWENHLKFIVYTSIQLFHIPNIWLAPKLLVRRLKYKYKYPHLMKYIINKPILGKELSDLYNKSKICLNIHVATHAGMHTGPNPRTFELLGCKCFEIIDEGHLDKTLLLNNKHLVEFTSSQDLISKIDYYLKNDSKRNAISQSGFLFSQKNYTIDILIKNALKDINLL